MSAIPTTLHGLTDDDLLSHAYATEDPSELELELARRVELLQDVEADLLTRLRRVGETVDG